MFRVRFPRERPFARLLCCGRRLSVLFGLSDAFIHRYGKPSISRGFCASVKLSAFRPLLMHVPQQVSTVALRTVGPNNYRPRVKRLRVAPSRKLPARATNETVPLVPHRRATFPCVSGHSKPATHGRDPRLHSAGEVSVVYSDASGSAAKAQEVAVITRSREGAGRQVLRSGSDFGSLSGVRVSAMCCPTFVQVVATFAPCSYRGISSAAVPSLCTGNFCNSRFNRICGKSSSFEMSEQAGALPR